MVVRVGLVVLVFVMAYGALLSGVGFSERGASGALTKAYYAMGLFVLGGLDLGVPKGEGVAVGLLWLAYFMAPALTTSALVEGLIRAMGPGWRRWRHRSDHVVIFGFGRLAQLYIERLRREDPAVPIVVVDREEHHTAALNEIRVRQRVYLMRGRCGEPGTMARVGAPNARVVLLLTGDDFANLEGATHLLETSPEAGDKTLVHVADLGLRRTIANTRVGRACTVFNRHEAAARRLVEHYLAPRFNETTTRDTVVLAGFGRFGQTVLDQLQLLAKDAIGEVIAVDLAADRKAAAFRRSVGFLEQHELHVIEGDLADQRIWHQVETLIDGPTSVIAATGDDGLNLRLALAIKDSAPEAYVVARTFHESAFAAEVCQERDILDFSLAELVEDAIVN